jgi:hypothetical protein
MRKLTLEARDTGFEDAQVDRAAGRFRKNLGP